MDFNQIMENIKKEHGEIPKPLEMLGKLDESMVVNHISDRQFAYSKEAVPQKYKILIALSAVIALGSEPCILNYAKAAKKAGASTQEIMETFAVAKFSKMGTVLSSSSPALEWLANNK